VTTYFCWSNKFSLPLPTSVGPTNLSTYFFSLRCDPLSPSARMPAPSLHCSSALPRSRARTKPALLVGAAQLASAAPCSIAHRPCSWMRRPAFRRGSPCYPAWQLLAGVLLASVLCCSQPSRGPTWGRIMATLWPVVALHSSPASQTPPSELSLPASIVRSSPEAIHGEEDRRYYDMWDLTVILC
jgi:hypothetical protein